ncbi:MAG: hypothetical protein D6741_10895, partial [Planctomycetota bacterium]
MRLLAVWNTTWLCRTVLLVCAWSIGAWSQISVVCAQTRTGSTEATANPASSSEDVVRFRRILVPEEYLDQAREDVPYLPIARDEFERLVRESRAARSLTRLPKAAIVHAEYTARLDGEDLVGRDSFWDVACWGTRETFLSLGNPTIALEGAYRPDDITSPLVFGSLDDGTVGTLVDRPGRIVFTWTAKGRHDLDGTLRFDLQFPPAAAGSLTLELPSDAKPVVDDGIVIEQRGETEDGGVSYRIGLPGSGRLIVRILEQPSENKQQAAVTVREQRLYDVSPRGLDAVLRFSVDILDQPLDRCRLRIERGLRIVSVSVDGADVSWNRVAPEASAFENTPPAEHAEDTPSAAESLKTNAAEDLREWEVIELQLPRPLVGTSRNIEVRAIKPWAKQVRLPHVVFEDAFWESGEAGVLVRSPLTTTDLDYRGARLLDAGLSPGEASGEMFELGLFDPDAELTWTTRLAETNLRFEETTTASLGEEEIVAETLLKASASNGNAFSLLLSVRPGWRIEQVDGIDEAAVRDWNFQPEQGDRPGSLEVVLSSPVGPMRPVSLRILARASVASLGSGERGLASGDRDGITVPLEALLPIRSSVADFERRTLQVDPGPGVEAELDWAGAETDVMVVPETADAAEGTPGSRLLSQSAEAEASPVWIFNAERPAALPRLVFRRRAARFDVARNVRWLLREDGTRLEYRFVVTTRDPIASIQIACKDWDKLTDVELAWRRSDDPIRTRFAPLTMTGTGSVRSIRLPRPTVEPFEIRLRSKGPESAGTLPIFDVLDASVETLQVHVFSEQGFLPRIVVRGLERVDADPVEEPGYRYVVSYRNTDIGENVSPLLQIQGLMREKAPKLWAWQERHQTRVTSSGTTYHRLVYLLHQELPANPKWTLPESVLLFDDSDPEVPRTSARDEQSNLRLFVDRVLVDGRPAIWRIAEVEGKPSLLVNLPDTV